MAATALTTRTVTASAGLVDTAKVAADNVNGNTFTNGPTTWVELTSSAGGTVTFTTPYTVSGNAVADKVVTLTGAQTIRVGPFDPSVYGDPVTFTASASTITVGVYQLGGYGS